MTSPALLALTAPNQVPEAAVARLQETATLLLADSLTARAGLYADLLSRLAAMAQVAAPLLLAAYQQHATEADLAGLANAQRVAGATVHLFEELARRYERRARIYAMQWARWARVLWADVTLTQREFLPTAYLGLDWVTAQTLAPIRILPGAENAILMLGQDPVLVGSSWDLSTLASTLARSVLVRV